MSEGRGGKGGGVLNFVSVERRNAALYCPADLLSAISQHITGSEHAYKETAIN